MDLTHAGLTFEGRMILRNNKQERKPKRKKDERERKEERVFVSVYF